MAEVGIRRQIGELEVFVFSGALVLALLTGIAFLISKRHFTIPVIWDKIVGLMMIIVLISPFGFWVGGVTVSTISNQFAPDLIHPTHEELRRRGFYTFELPEEEIESRQWEQEIAISSWNVHCGVLLGDTYNPLVIRYLDNDEIEVFRIQLVWRMTWNIVEAENRTQIDLDTDWADPNQLTHYSQPTADNNLSRNLYHFQDMQGYGVDIVSSLPVTETLELIRRLEYVGPPMETLKDPWYCGN